MAAKKMPKPEPASPLAMDLGQVLNHFIESRMPFVIAFNPDEKSDNLFKAAVDGLVCSGSDPVGALIGAAAKAIRATEAKVTAVRGQADKHEKRVGLLQERLPGVRAHVPNEKGVCLACGQKHDGAVDREAINSLRYALNLAVNDQDDDEREDN